MPVNRSYLLPIRDYSIAIEEYGDSDGFPVLALHGWLDNSASFYAIGEQLQGVRLIAMDLVGHGQSSFRPRGMPYHIWDNLTDLNSVIHELGLNEVNLIGHSMGASIAALFAGAFPNRVARLMCIEGLVPLHYEAEQLPQDFADALIKRDKMVNKKLKPYVQREDAIRTRINGRWPVSREAAEKLLEKGLVETNDGFFWSHDPNLMLPSLVRFEPEQIRSFLRSIEADSTVIKGTAGVSYLIDGWIDEIKSCDLLELEGGHHLHMEAHASGEIANIINDWAK